MSPPTARQSDTAPPVLQANTLECVRGDLCLFADLSFALGPGEALYVRGANGTGKTSLLRILAGLTLPEAGAVCWRGADIRTHRSAYVAELAYVGHTHAVKAELTALENLQALAALGPGPARATPVEALAQVGLEGYESIAGRYLSAGQRRRVALARLLLGAAALWILDEPLTAVDTDGIASFESVFAAFLAAGGILVYTSHHPIRLDAGRGRELEL